MSISPAPDVEQAFYRAACRATLAPSIHNTQPWRFVVRPQGLDIYADPTRQLRVIDPQGRQQAISCGSAVFLARAALAADQIEASTALLPDLADSERMATLTLVGRASQLDADAVRLDRASDSRRSNRRQFAGDDVPPGVIETLRHAAVVERAWLQPVTTLDDRIAVATLSQHADALQNADPAYRAEVREWTSGDDGRRDGIPASAIPHNVGAAHDDVPIRDLDTQGTGELPEETRSSLGQTMLVLGTDGDDPADWLSAGQALCRILLEATSAGYVASIFSQMTEVSGPREQLRHDLRLGGHPQLLLRLGHADPTPATPRRELDEVIRRA